MEFKLDSFFNPHLPLGARRIDAVISASCLQAAASHALRSAPKAICLIVDASGSMEGDKLRSAKIAARRCIDLLEPGTLFSVIAFANQAQAIVPMGQANPGRIAAAHQAIQAIGSGGGTYMSKALEEAKIQFDQAHGAIKAAMFLTDGENDQGDLKALKNAIARCSGAFACDCRGLGKDWHPDELRLISNALSGNADACVDPDRLEEDFKSFIARAMGKLASDAKLRIWCPKIAKIHNLKQMSPDIVDLMPIKRTIDEKTTEFALGNWGAETRDYHLSIDLPAGAQGDEMIACKASIVLGSGASEAIFMAPHVVATWSADASMTARINGQVAHYTGQGALAESIREGLQAMANRQPDVATKLLGQAAKIAHDSGNDEVTARLKKVVDIVDIDAGTVRLKAGIGKAETLELDMGGTRTVRKRSGLSTPVP